MHLILNFLVTNILFICPITKFITYKQVHEMHSLNELNMLTKLRNSRYVGYCDYILSETIFHCFYNGEDIYRYLR